MSQVKSADLPSLWRNLSNSSGKACVSCRINGPVFYLAARGIFTEEVATLPVL